MTKFDPQMHHRRSIRLKEYDYSLPGAYFVTLVAFQREAVLGEIIDGEVKLLSIIITSWFKMTIKKLNFIKNLTLIKIIEYVSIHTRHALKTFSKFA